MSLRFALSLLAGVAVVAFVLWGLYTVHPLFVLVVLLVVVPLLWWFEYGGWIDLVQMLWDKLRRASEKPKPHHG